MKGQSHASELWQPLPLICQVRNIRARKEDQAAQAHKGQPYATQVLSRGTPQWATALIT